MSEKAERTLAFLLRSDLAMLSFYTKGHYDKTKRPLVLDDLDIFKRLIGNLVI